MTWKPVESVVIPEQHLRPVGHVLMPEWSGADRVQHRSPLFSIGLIIDLHGRPVPITFYVLFLGLTKDFQVPNACRWPDNRFQVTLYLCLVQLSHERILY